MILTYRFQKFKKLEEPRLGLRDDRPNHFFEIRKHVLCVKVYAKISLSQVYGFVQFSQKLMNNGIKQKFVI